MKQPTIRNPRDAVILAVILTMIAMFALLDPSCRQDGALGQHASEPSVPTR